MVFRTLDNLTIRQLLLSLLTLLGLLTLAGSLWEGWSVHQALRQAHWVVETNSIVDASLHASSAMAQERGITAAILANPGKATPAMRGEMEKLRHTVDASYAELVALGAELPRLSDNHPLPGSLQKLASQRGVLDSARNRIDRQLAGGDVLVTDKSWIAIASQFIDALASTRRATSAPLNEVGYASMPNPLIMEALFTISEYAGRERAIIGTAIAQNRPLSADELSGLRQYRNIVEISLDRVDASIKQFPPDDNFSAALTGLSSQFLGRYQELREQVYRASDGQRPYPVDVSGWYAEATRGIDSILVLADAVNNHIERAVNLTKQHAMKTAVLLVLVVLFAFSAVILASVLIKRRIIVPLVRLQGAADTIAAGDLTQSIVISNNDEIGALGRALEHMRGTLRDDIRERERAAGELRKLSQAIEQSTDAVLITNRDRDIEYVNAAFERSRGYERGQLIGKNARILKTGHTEEAIYQEFTQALECGEPFNGVFTNARADGGYYCEELTVNPLRDESGTVTHYVASGKDITERVEAERELRKLTQVIEQSVSSIIITDTRGRVEYVNPEFCRNTGYSREEVQGRKLSLLKSGQTPRSSYESLWRTIQAGDVWEGEFLNKRKDGSLFWVMVSISPVCSASGEVSHFVGIQHDISERKSLEERVDSLENYDELTQLPNRTMLAQLFDLALSRAEKNGSPMAVLTLDIDRFKLINDSLGHGVGDRLLRLVARGLSQAAREGDIIARFSNDEFVLVLTNIVHRDIVRRVAQRLLDVIATPHKIDTYELRLTGSIGISLYPQDGNDLQSLLRSANAAMHEARREGGRNYQFYIPALGDKASVQLRLEAELRHAIANDELVVYYQPKVNFATGKITSMEALVRWIHPTDGLISPTEFIPLAEDTGLIVDLGEWVLRHSCRQNMAWQQAGLPPVTVAVNVSARQLHNNVLLKSVQKVLDETGMEARFLELELTETAVMGNPEECVQLLQQLKELGVRLALDDFGTGYSSLSYLRRFPFDTLKIDRAFVTNITSDPEECTIALAVIAMAHSLRLKVVAEGVETEAQAAYLHYNNCDELQGYLFSRPVPGEEMEILLREKRTLSLPTRDTDFLVNTLLLVDDDPRIISALRRLFKDEGYHLLTAQGPAEAFELLALHGAGVIISDQRMPEMTGIEFLSRVSELYPETVCTMLSGHGDLEAVSRAINAGIIDKYFSKPWDDDELVEQIKNAFAMQRRQRKKASA